MHLVYPSKCRKTFVFDFSWNDLPRQRRFLSCMALSIYEVIRVACLPRSWFAYSQGVKRQTSASRVGMTVISRRNWKQRLHVCKIDLFTDTVAILNLNRFKEYYGMPRGHSLSIYARFLAKNRTSIYISQEKGDRYYIQRRHNDFFFLITIFFWENLKKNWPEKRA